MVVKYDINTTIYSIVVQVVRDTDKYISYIVIVSGYKSVLCILQMFMHLTDTKETYERNK